MKEFAPQEARTPATIDPMAREAAPHAALADPAPGAQAAFEASPRVIAQRQLADRLNASPRARQFAAGGQARPDGGGLPGQLKAGVEALSGMSMDHVRVHRNSSRPAQLNALAYAQGRDIHLAPGQESHLPHEAWHVVQQAQGRVRATMQAKGTAINDDPALEREADSMGERAMRVSGAAEAASAPAAVPPAAPVQRVLNIANSSVGKFEELKFRHFKSLRKRYNFSIDTWVRLRKMASSRLQFSYRGWGEAIERAAALSDGDLAAEAQRHGRHRNYQEMERRGIEFTLEDAPVRPSPSDRPRTYKHYTQQTLGQAIDGKSMMGGLKFLLDQLPMLPPGGKYDRHSLTQALANVQMHEKGDKSPYEKLTKVGSRWYTREQLRQAMHADPDLDFDPALIRHHVEGKYKSFGQINHGLREREAQEQKKRRELEKQAQQRELEERRQREDARPTPMDAMLGESERMESAIGRAAATHEHSLRAAHALAAQVHAFVEEYHRAQPPSNDSDNLYVRMAADKSDTSGAVPKVPEMIRQALLEGTLQEKLTHVLNFRKVIGDLVVRNDEQAQLIARKLGFSVRVLDLMKKGENERAFNELENLKDRMIAKREQPRQNTQSIGALGIPFSTRERAMWSEENQRNEIPEFGVGHTGVTFNEKDEWVTNARRLGFPLRSGPSTHTYELFQMLELLGVDNVPIEQLKLAAMGYLMPIGAHSLIEIQHTAEQFGADHQASPSLYARTMAALGIGSKLAVRNGNALRALLKAKDGSEQDKLVEAHHLLLSSGYVFIGYHGTKQVGYDGILSGGFNEDFETRVKSDPWRGVYFAPDTTVARGYIPSTGGGGLLRVYAPASVVAAFVQARLPLDDILSHEELARRLGMRQFIPNPGDHMIMGRERSHASSAKEANALESVMSWSAARQCIAIPSMHTSSAESHPERRLANDVTVPSTLSFEHLASSGGLDLSHDEDERDPADWRPEKEHGHTGGAWEEQRAKYVDSASGEMPTRRQIVLLQRLGFKVAYGMSWRAVGALTLPSQMNAATLQEMLPLVEHLSSDSPAWTDFVAKVRSAGDYSLILPGIYLSGWRAAMDLDWQQGHVGAVMNCCQFSFPHAQGVQYEAANVTGYSNGLFEWASNKIEAQQRKGILVHCIEGKNRSATVLAAFLMKSMRWNAAKATRYLTAKRPWAEPDLPSLLNWERYLLAMGYIQSASTLFGHEDKHSGAHAPRREQDQEHESDDWVGLAHALRESMMDAGHVAQVMFTATGSAIGLNRYMSLHNASGRYNNCLIYSVAGALGLHVSDERVTEIGEAIRKSRVGVEQNGYLNAAAIPRILHELGQGAVRVILIHTTGLVDSAETGGTPTYAAEIVNSDAGRTIVLVNQGYIHFGWGVLRERIVPRVFHDEVGDGARWIQFVERDEGPGHELMSVGHAPDGMARPLALHVFNLPPDARPDTALLRRLYRQQALALHPDRNYGRDTTELFKLLQAAYEALTGKQQKKDDETRSLE
jgi:hypothetical protein